MAGNKPISDNTAFPFETNVRAIAGLAGYITGTPNSNVKIGGTQLVQSVINGGSANAGGLAVYATSGAGKELATYISLNYSSGTTSTPAILELGTPSHPSTVQISGNFNGPDPFVSPKVSFLTKNATTGSNTVSISPASAATADQNIILPEAQPSATGEILQVQGISGDDVTLEWSAQSTTSSAVLQTVYNNTVSTLNKGQVVYLPGGNQGDNPHVELAQSNSSSTMPALGVVTNNITASSTGTVMVTGELTGVDLTGFTTGDDLYISSTVAGGLQNTPPTGEANLIQKIGKVVNGGPGGALTVLGAFRANATPNLNEGSIFIGNSNNQAQVLPISAGVGDVLTSNGTTASWQAPSGGGGGGYQTLTPGLTVSWSAGSGLSAELTPSATSSPNTISMTGFSAGDTGALKIIPTTTAAFRLPSNSKAAGGNITISSSNPSILEYFYDGTTFYWWPESNMIDPIYFPVINETGLIAFYVPNTYTGGAGNVPSGSAWINSFTSNNLIGDLTRQGTDADDVQFVERDDATSTPAHFVLGSDGTSTGYFDRATNLSTTSFGGDWTGIIWVLANSTTSTTSYGALIDGDKDDDEAMYMDERRLCMYNSGGGGYIYSNFPALVDSGNTGNDNAFDLEDEWVYFGLSVDDTANAITFFIGCQATLDNAGSTIIGYDGTNINIDANGLYRETVSTTIGEGTWNDFIIGAASTGSFHYEGAIGMAAVYNQTTDITVHTSNWNNTKSYYYIS